ncbi:MAG: hypothetical protein JXA60_07060 [Candidatus Coatesbacteria bacterium]|nr:hypothetical protein [Candidatus Coatesbacteria bacterium]
MEIKIKEIHQKLLARNKEANLEEIEQAYSYFKNALNFFAGNEELTNLISLLLDYKKSSSVSTLLNFEENKYNDEDYVSISILSGDWPGLADSCTGLIHHLGFNIHYVRGMIIPFENENLGYVIIVLRFADKQEYGHFQELKPRIIHILQYISIGMKSKEKILSSGNYKLFLLNDLIRIIQTEISSWNEDLKRRITKEIELFIMSRSTAYLQERSPETIAEQILINFSFHEKTKATHGKIQVRIKDIDSQQQPLSNITIAGYAGQISLDSCLDSIRKTIPDMIIKYNKDFTSPEGIIIIQVEMVHQNESLLSEVEKEELINQLQNLSRRKRLYDVFSMDGKGGIENELRIIIPALVKEYQRSSTPQVLIDLKRETDLLLEFRLMVVNDTEEDNQSISAKLISIIQASRGVQIKTIVPPRIIGNVEVTIFDLEALKDAFSSHEDIYEHLKQQLTETIGKFRDFDEGMRRRDISNLKLLVKSPEFAGYSEEQIKQIYFNLDDFYRAGAFFEEITAQTKFCLDTLKEARASGKNTLVKGICTYRFLANQTKIPLSSIIAVFLAKDRAELLPKWIEIFPSTEVTMSKIPFGLEVVYLFRLTKEKKALEDNAFENLITEIEKAIT